MPRISPGLGPVLLACLLAACGDPTVPVGRASPRPSATALATDAPAPAASAYPVLAGDLGDPNGLDVDATGRLVVADAANHRIVVVQPDGRASSLAGSTRGYADGPAKQAKFDTPFGVCAARDGSVYVADTGNHRLRRIAADGTVTTLAGTGSAAFADGAATAAAFDRPYAVAIDALDALLVADTGNHRIRKLAKGQVTTLAGQAAGFADGDLAAARFAAPNDLALDAAGHVYVADLANHAVRVLDPVARTVRTLAGTGVAGHADGPGNAATFDAPTGLVVGPDGTVYVADPRAGNVRAIDAKGQVTSPFAGLAAHDLAVTPGGALVAADATRHALVTLRQQQNR